MKQKIALLLAGILVGGLVMAVVPVNAHHGSDFRSLNRKIKRLQNKTSKLQSRTVTLETKTQFLDEEGFYFASVVGQQVISVCPDQSNATWEQIPFEGNEEIRWIDTCLEEEPASSVRSRLSPRALDALTRR